MPRMCNERHSLRTVNDLEDNKLLSSWQLLKFCDETIYLVILPYRKIYILKEPDKMDKQTLAKLQIQFENE